MKIIFFVVSLCALLLGLPAWATGTPPLTTPPIEIDISGTVSAQSNAKAQAAAAAAAKAKADALAVSGDSESYSASKVMNQNSSKMFVFPAPVWTQVPQAYGCFVTESHAIAVGWNLASGSKSIQFSDPICVSGRMAENARLMCQFVTADYLDRNVFRLMFPRAGDLPESAGLKNMSLAECEELKRPRLVLTPALAPVVHTPAPLAQPVPAPVRPARADRQ